MIRYLASAIIALSVVLVCGSSAHAVLPGEADPIEPAPISGWEEPATCFKDTEAEVDDCIYHLNNLGLAYQYEKKLDLAIQRFTQLLEIKEHPEALVNRGIVYVHQKDYVRARRDFVRSSVLAPQVDKPWINLASVDFAQRQFRQALTHVNRAIRINPKDAEYRLLRAEILVSLREHRLAAQDIRLAIQIMRTEPKGTILEKIIEESAIEVRK